MSAPTEARRGRGRPAIGARVEIRLGDEPLAAIDRIAEHDGRPRADVVRMLVDEALAARERRAARRRT